MTQKDRGSVVSTVKALRLLGTNLGFPASSQIEGRLRELRCGAVRVFYVFDSQRHAVLLIGGAKNDKQLYDSKRGVVAFALKQFAAWEAKLEAERNKKAAEKKSKEAKQRKK